MSRPTVKRNASTTAMDEVNSDPTETANRISHIKRDQIRDRHRIGIGIGIGIDKRVGYGTGDVWG